MNISVILLCVALVLVNIVNMQQSTDIRHLTERVKVMEIGK